MVIVLVIVIVNYINTACYARPRVVRKWRPASPALYNILKVTLTAILTLTLTVNAKP